jgi:hypothetical protein
MSAFERLLVPGCTELPVCRCGEEMEITSFDEFPASSDAVDAAYCLGCGFGGLSGPAFAGTSGWH